MTLLWKNTVEMIEGADELRFTVNREKAWLQNIVSALFLAIFTASVWRSHNPFFLIFAAIGLASTIYYWTRGTPSILVVTQNRLITLVNAERLDQVYLELFSSQITSLGYFVGQENEAAGLYAQQKRSQTLLLPGLDEQQTNYIIDSIYNRFPDFARAADTSASLLHGNDSGVISLGIGGQGP